MIVELLKCPLLSYGKGHQKHMHMNKVYNYLNSLNYYPEGVVEILGTTYRITRVHNLRYSERPEFRGVSRPSFGIWYIQPQRGVYLKVELI